VSRASSALIRWEVAGDDFEEDRVSFVIGSGDDTGAGVEWPSAQVGDDAADRAAKGKTCREMDAVAEVSVGHIRRAPARDHPGTF